MAGQRFEVELLDVELLDIEQLDEQLLGGGFDVGTTSFHAALYLADDHVVLPSGSALGSGRPLTVLS